MGTLGFLNTAFIIPCNWGFLLREKPLRPLLKPLGLYRWNPKIDHHRASHNQPSRIPIRFLDFRVRRVG